jgi:hypothetical protein
VSRKVFVCRKCKDHQCLVGVLEAHADLSLQLVKCQKICHGPVVGTVVDGRFEWFERVSSVKELAGLLRLTRKKAPSAIPKPLRKRRVKRHAGRPPRV